MRLKELLHGLEDLDMVVFDKEALVVFQSGPTPKEDLVIALLPALKDADRLELIHPRECLIKVGRRKILMRKLGDYIVALIQGEGDREERCWLDMIRLEHRLAPEFPSQTE